MTGVIRLSAEDLNARIEAYESKWAEFATVYSEPTCCPGCMIPYDRWGLEQCSDWDDYLSLRWLRGDEITWEADGD